MSIVVYWLDRYECKMGWLEFTDGQLTEALACAEKKRKAGLSHVCISSELDDQVGKPGVSSVEDGKTPDGFDYEWSKQHRGGPPAPKT